MPVRYCMAAALSLALSMAYAQEPVFDDNGTPMYEVNFVDTELGEFCQNALTAVAVFIVIEFEQLQRLSQRALAGGERLRDFGFE